MQEEIMQILFILNPTAGKTDCTRELPRQIEEAATRAGSCFSPLQYLSYNTQQNRNQIIQTLSY